MDSYDGPNTATFKPILENKKAENFTSPIKIYEAKIETEERISELEILPAREFVTKTKIN